MGQIADLMGSDLTGLRQPPGPGLSVAENAEILALAVGSGRAAARRLGVGESTFRGWRKGVQPRKGAGFLVQAARAAAVNAYRPRHYLNVMDGTNVLAIRGLIVKSSDARTRTIHPGRDIPLVKIRNIVRAWLAGQDDRVDRLTYKAIDEHYVEDLQFDDIIGVWFE